MSIKRNFIYNSVLTVSGYVFTLLTYPYVSRVLGLSNIGIVNFVDGLINYFILFAMMGTTTLGIREIAINKYDKDKYEEFCEHCSDMEQISQNAERDSIKYKTSYQKLFQKFSC